MVDGLDAEPAKEDDNMEGYIIPNNHENKCGTKDYDKYRGLLICSRCGETLLSLQPMVRNCAAVEARKDNGAGSAGVIA